MKSRKELQDKGRELLKKLQATGQNPELQRKLVPLVQATNLQAGDKSKLAVLVGEQI